MITPERERIWRELIRGGKKTFPAAVVLDLLNERGMPDCARCGKPFLRTQARCPACEPERTPG